MTSALRRNAELWGLVAALALAAILRTPLAVLGSVGLRALDVLGFLVTIKLFADACAALGLFRWLAGALERRGRGHRALALAGLGALAAGVTSLLSLDATVVLVTPVAIGLARRFGRPPAAYALLALWLANAGSLLFPMANLTNLLALHQLGLSSVAFLRRTVVAQGLLWLLCAAWGAVMLRAVARPAGSGRGGSPSAHAAPSRRPDRRTEACSDVAATPAHQVTAPDAAARGDAPRAAGLLVLACAAAVLAGCAPWLAAGAAFLGSCAVLALHRRSRELPALLRGTPWRPAAFALALFVVVAALQPYVVALLGPHLPAAGVARRWALGGLGAVAANVGNNLPGYLALEPLAHGPSDVWAVLAAANVAPMLTPWGSLANLLWLDVCRAHRVRIGAWRMVLLSVPVAVVGTVIALLALP